MKYAEKHTRSRYRNTELFWSIKIALVAGGELNNFEKYRLQQNISIVQQVNRLGTGDAVAAALAFENTELPSYCKSNFVFGEKINSDYT